MSGVYQIRPCVIGWKVPFNLALALHVLLLSSAVILPRYLHRNPIMPDAYSVDLVNIADFPGQAAPAASTPPQQTAPTLKAPKPKTVKAEKTAPIAPAVVNEAPAPPVQAVSLKPLKRKLKKKIPPAADIDTARTKREAQERQRQLLAEARQQKAIADAEAKAAASEALNALKQSLRADAMAASAKKGTGGTGNRRGGGTSSSLEAQYFSQIFSHLHQYWALPDIKAWNPQLTAVVVVRISKNGRIIEHHFESRSGDSVFDRFVSRTMEEANPLPGIPAALKKKEITIGLRFRPGGIQ